MRIDVRQSLFVWVLCFFAIASRKWWAINILVICTNYSNIVYRNGLYSYTACIYITHTEYNSCCLIIFNGTVSIIRMAVVDFHHFIVMLISLVGSWVYTVHCTSGMKPRSCSVSHLNQSHVLHYTIYEPNKIHLRYKERWNAIENERNKWKEKKKRRVFAATYCIIYFNLIKISHHTAHHSLAN